MSKSNQYKNIGLILIVLLSVISVLFHQVTRVMAANSYRVDDQAGLLEEEESIALAAELDRISERYNTDIVILTLGENIAILNLTDYADTYYENKNLGLGATQSGMLFIISMAERDWAIATHGEAIDIFNDYAQEQLIEEIRPTLGDNNMSAAFRNLAAFSETTLENYESGIIAEPDSSRSFLFYLLPPVLALILTAIIMRSLKSPLSSVGFHSGATSYLIDDSMAIANANEFFLSSSVTRTIIPKNTENRNSGGASTTHTSSSGKTVGGSSGKF